MGIDAPASYFVIAAESFEYDIRYDTIVEFNVDSKA